MVCRLGLGLRGYHQEAFGSLGACGILICIPKSKASYFLQRKASIVLLGDYQIQPQLTHLLLRLPERS